MSLHVTIATIIQAPVTKARTYKVCTSPGWSDNHRLSSYFLYHLLLSIKQPSASSFGLLSKHPQLCPGES